MITIAQLNEIPRPSWLSAYSNYPGMAEFCAAAYDRRRLNDELVIDVWDTTKSFRDMPRIDIYPAGGTFHEKIEFLQHAKAVAALFTNPKVRFCR